MSRTDLHATPSVDDRTARSVSSNNPCPFLRALVAVGRISGHVEQLSKIADVIVASSSGSPSETPVSKSAVFLIAMIANGLGPAKLVISVRDGARLDQLRSGPLDKRGAGSRILDANARIDERELARLDEFAIDKMDASGAVERGLGIEQLRGIMDANFERAADIRRKIDRSLMNGEWPILLRVMGQDSAGGRYLSLTRITQTFCGPVSSPSDNTKNRSQS
jgi:hypothetical protein